MKLFSIMSLLIGLLLVSCSNTQLDDAKNKQSKLNDDSPKNTIDYIDIPISEIDNIHHLTPQEFVFKVCLSQNYHQITNQSNEDVSPFHYSYHTIQEIAKFVEKEAGEFYKEVMPIYSEDGRKSNVIFSRCLAFSTSQKVDDFLNELQPHECRTPDDDVCPEYHE